ncbi:DNA topoisomerase 2-associated protein pat1 [Neonectria magnoliae]|uniref:DNA topoisomerase 2-associated protein pat1 n=1 Tax=Neonectria magnoliae TaxID=2732573 RepID=A0ABR1I8I2_9HYPO
MSFFGFDATGRHNTTAPGFSQTHDPFAGLSGRDGEGDDALDFEDTYDGLGDQLDETGDAFNDDTFGDGGAPSTNRTGKDFDFFGQTAKVANAIDEEHLRYHRQQPAMKPTVAVQPPAHNMQSYYSHQQTQRPVRTGYEKYQDSEPLPDLHVDRSIWGIGPAKPVAQASPALQASQPASRKVMSLEEVEAAMRAQPKKPTPQPPVADLAYAQSGYPTPQQQHAQPHGHGHPVQILQRPQNTQSKPTPPAQGSHVPPPSQQHQQASTQPTQILQNPNRLSGDAARIGASGHQTKLSQGAIAQLAQLQQHPQMMQMSEDEKAAFLDQETKRAKRNHKIWLLSKDNGLMTPQDKNFITRIQLQQLVSATGNPVEGSDASIAEDFYYQVYSHIRAGQRQNPSQPLSNFAQTYLYQTGSRQGGMRRHGRPAENHFQRMEQQVQRAVEAAKNKPKNPQLVIAGSLGKISFSNAKTPKPLLSIKRTDNDSPRPSSGKKSALDRKTILRNVEKVYQTLLQIEDHVRLIPPPITNPADEELQSKHKEWATILETYNARLWHELKVHEPIGATVPHPFIAFLSCAKGEKAIPRLFPHLSFEQRTTILTMIIYHLDQLDVVQGAAIIPGETTTLNARMREKIELFISTVMPSLMQYFNDTGLDIVDGVLNLIATKLNVDLIARARIGVSMLTLILSRAVLLKQTGAGNPEQWEKWDRTFETLFARLEPSLPYIFPGSVNTGEDVYVWQLLAAMGVSATHDQQTRLVLAVKDRVLDTVTLSKTLPPTMAADRLSSVNLFMRSIGLDVELLQ